MKTGPLQMVIQIFTTTMRLPKRIQAICGIQPRACIGGILHRKHFTRVTNQPDWFPFLFYSPTWAGEVYFRNLSFDPTKEDSDKSGVDRIGSLALVVFSISPSLVLFSFPWY